MEDSIMKIVSEAPALTIAFYVLFNINKNLTRLADTVDKLERRIERLEDTILKGGINCDDHHP